MQYFFINQDISGNHVVVTDEELLYQIRYVLRFEKGDECVLLNGKGEKAKGTVETIDKKAVIIRLENHEIFDRPKRKVSLYIAISKKPATFELIIQKATELGVTGIIPLVTEHCQVREIRNEKRLSAIIKEAAEQCERVFLPKLHPVLLWDKFTADPPSGQILTGDARGGDVKLCDVKFSLSESVNLIIGPEGGLTEGELSDVHRIGGRIFSLGENVLRMETAAIAALGVVLCR